MLKNYILPFILFASYQFGVGQVQSNTPNSMDHNKRMACALFGAAAGDALGRITEFIPSRQEILKKYPHGVSWFGDICPVALPSGQVGYPYTDDTVMMLIVLEEVEKNYKQPEKTIDALASRFADLFDPEKKYQIDPLYNLRAHGLTNTRSCLEIGSLIKQGKSWKDRETSFEKVKRESGCGSVMRVWPIGFFYHNDLEQAIKVADMQSSITHRNPAARAACAAAAAGFATLCNGKSFDEVATAMICVADRYNEEERVYKQDATTFSDSLDQNLKLISQDQMLTSDMLRHARWAAENNVLLGVVLGECNDLQSNYRSFSGALLGWRADETIAAVLYILLRHKEDFFGALSEAVNTPGDSDSIASLVGAFSGYAYGLQESLFEREHVLELENASRLINFNTCLPLLRAMAWQAA